jgi:hypothetical protein
MGQLLQMLILKGLAGKMGDSDKKMPIWRFIPLSMRDGAELALPGSRHTFTH